ncbi:MAG TPA: nucleotidyltransferase family protein [Flavitalea sp.]|nr:nucleotidyltransferase family protein [Flavitalea sp.]
MQPYNPNAFTTGTGRLKGMIFAAGLGTRFKPWTDKHPKALAPVNGKPLLQHNVEYLMKQGIVDIVVNVHHFAGQVEEALIKNAGWGAKITISDEREEVLETGGGLKKAQAHLCDSPFVLMNADVLTDMDLGAMIHQHQQLKPLATLAVSDRQTSRYFLFDHFNDLCGWRNTTTGEERLSRTTADRFQKAFSGIHIIEPRVFSLITESGKFSMVDLYLRLSCSEIIKAFDHTGSKFIDVGKPASVELAEQMFQAVSR